MLDDLMCIPGMPRPAAEWPAWPGVVDHSDLPRQHAPRLQPPSPTATTTSSRRARFSKVALQNHYSVATAAEVGSVASAETEPCGSPGPGDDDTLWVSALEERAGSGAVPDGAVYAVPTPVEAAAAGNGLEAEAEADTDQLEQTAALYRSRREALLSGRHPVTDAEAITLGALQLQIEFGEFVRPGSFDLGMVLPRPTAGQPEAEARVFAEHDQFHRWSDHMAREEFVRLSRSSPTYGAVIFPVKERVRGRAKLTNRLLGISTRAVLCLDPETAEVVSSYDMSTVRKWTIAEDAGEKSRGGSLNLQIGSGLEATTLQFSTRNGAAISRVGTVLVLALQKRNAGGITVTAAAAGPFPAGSPKAAVRRRHSAKSREPGRPGTDAAGRWSWAAGVGAGVGAGSTQSLPSTRRPMSWAGAGPAEPDTPVYWAAAAPPPGGGGRMRVAEPIYSTAAMWSTVNATPGPTDAEPGHPSAPPCQAGAGASQDHRSARPVPAAAAPTAPLMQSTLRKAATIAGLSMMKRSGSSRSMHLGAMASPEPRHAPPGGVSFAVLRSEMARQRKRASENAAAFAEAEEQQSWLG